MIMICTCDIASVARSISSSIPDPKNAITPVGQYVKAWDMLGKRVLAAEVT